jgi:hypothetical protein
MDGMALTTRLVFMIIFEAAVHGGVVIDRIAVIVGKHAIKTSDIDLDIRITDFLNRVPFRSDLQEERRSAERLIDQEIIRQEIIAGGFQRPPAEEAAELEKQFTRDHFGGSDARFRSSLTVYGVMEDQLRAQLLWQLTVLQFIDQRFRAEAFVSDDEVRAYYEQHRADFPSAVSFEQAEQEIHDRLEGERINKSFTDWLEQSRKRNRIEYREEAFR